MEAANSGNSCSFLMPGKKACEKSPVHQHAGSSRWENFRLGIFLVTAREFASGLRIRNDTAPALHKSCVQSSARSEYLFLLYSHDFSPFVSVTFRKPSSWMEVLFIAAVVIISKLKGRRFYEHPHFFSFFGFNHNHSLFPFCFLCVF